MQDLPTSDGQPGHNGHALPYCVWEIPPAKMQFRLSLAVVETLSRDVMEGFKTVPRRGLEVGGVLLGRIAADQDSAVVSVDSAVPLDCEHERGPSLWLSERDMRVLADLVAAHPPDRETGMRVVGFYRSQTRHEMLLPDTADRLLMEQRFSGTPELFLMIRPSAGAGAGAALFLWDGEQFQSPDPCLEFPFQSAVLRSGEYRLEHGVGGTAAAPSSALAGVARPARAHHLAAVVDTQLKDPPMANPRRKLSFRVEAARYRAAAAAWLRRWSPRWERPAWSPGWTKPALSVAAVAAVVAAGAWGVHWYQQSVEPAPSSLALTVDRDAGALRVRWDRGAAAIRNARSATLWINDGARQDRLTLDTAQLRQGSVAYWPSNDDVNFRLEVLDARRTVTESVRVVGLAPPAPPPASPAAAPAPAAETAAVAPPRVKPSPFQQHRDAEAAQGDDSDLHPRTVFVSPSSQPAAAQPAAATPAPQIAKAATPPAELKPAAAPAPVTQVSMSYETSRESRVGRVVGKIPLIGRIHRRHEEDLTPPKPVEIFKPAVPAELGRSFAGEVPIDIKVHVGESGKVEDAELVSDVSGGSAARLADLALHAARRSKFSPARLGDRAVPADVVLHYRVTGSAAQIAAQPGTAE